MRLGPCNSCLNSFRYFDRFRITIIFSIVFFGFNCAVCIAGESGPGVVVCDHRYGAEATWSQSTDTSWTNFYFAEACGFKFNLGLTVFDSPLWPHWKMDIRERRVACLTGRLTYQIYLATDRWCDPRMSPKKQTYPLIPDYYNKKWTRDSVGAGFKVKVGDPKPSRFPNHGQELFDISGGKYGYDLKANTPGKIDVLSGLLDYQRNWIQHNFGYEPSVVAYANSQSGSSYRIPNYFLGARGGKDIGVLQYGTSKEGNGCLGGGGDADMSPAAATQLELTTRVADMKQPKAEVLAHAGGLLKKAIQSRGWYTDFIHWHSSSPYQKHLNLHDYFESQRSAMKGHDVVALDYGEALQHKFLRDMATVSAEDTPGGVKISVSYKDPYGTLPLKVFQIPLSVKVDLTSTSLAGKEICSPGAAGIRKLAPDRFIVEVPFRGRQETIDVLLKESPGHPEYMDFGLPKIGKVFFKDKKLYIEADKPVRVVVFTAPGEKGLQAVKPLRRENSFSRTHVLEMDDASVKALHEEDVYIGLITPTKQSILAGPLFLDASSGVIREK